MDAMECERLSPADLIRLAPWGEIPNSALPAVRYRGGLAPDLRSPSACQALFHRNGWGNGWLNGLYDYWHFHVSGHEVLGCVAGSAEIGLGGETGVALDFTAGDVLVLPAGTGHRRLSAASPDFAVVGAYPPGQSGAIVRPGDIPIPEAEHAIAKLALPEADPVAGPEGPLVGAWAIR
ncbi:hypothetical protein ACUN0C_10035 [Faunimonas sp. B44]|uniref:hypothetical protein n=1 Tax=Faunimonas sp. B44 TaxID=3461493 RepID=UPI004044DDD4